MNKADLIDMVASETGSTKVDAAKALEAVVEAVTGALAKGDSVSLVGFGTFSVRHRAARDGRNPQTGAPMHIPASKVPGFKAGKALKDKVKDVRISSRLTDSAVCLVGDDNAMDPQLEKILQQHNQLNQELSLKILEINSNHKLIKKLAKMCTKKDEIDQINKIATMLYEQSKILDGEKPTDPSLFSKSLIDTIYDSLA